MDWKTLNKILFASFILLALACSGKEEDASVDDSDLLYNSTLKIITKYTKIIQATSDSASLEEGFERFQNDMDSINRMVAPDTDLLLTENRNDTIYARMMVLVELYKKKHQGLSITTDTIAQGADITAMDPILLTSHDTHK